jgi:hypothetical protein
LGGSVGSVFEIENKQLTSEISASVFGSALTVSAGNGNPEAYVYANGTFADIATKAGGESTNLCRMRMNKTVPSVAVVDSNGNRQVALTLDDKSRGIINTSLQKDEKIFENQRCFPKSPQKPK